MNVAPPGRDGGYVQSMKRLTAAALTCAALLAAGCGDTRDTAAPPAKTTPQPTRTTVVTDRFTTDLRITVRDRDGATAKTAVVRCGPTNTIARGAGDAAHLCKVALDHADVLTSSGTYDRACTQQYGGPEQATVKGTVFGQQVDRRFARTNGCQIADWSAVADLFDAAR